MAAFTLLLIRKRQRWLRRQTIEFLDGVGLCLIAGRDFAQSWDDVSATILAPSPLGKLLRNVEGHSLVIRLEKLMTDYPIERDRLWFSLLRTLYLEGAPLETSVSEIAETMRLEQLRKLREHCRRAPTQINIVTILFFLPPVLIWTLFPLLLEFANGSP